jgi:hypothetical protein
MDSIARFFKKIGMLLRREKFNSELEEEMWFHREQKERELCESGPLRRPLIMQRCARLGTLRV